MTRVTCAVSSKQRVKKMLSQTKGFWGRRKNVKRQAHSALMKAKAYNYRDRKNKKRVFRRLWISRIGVAARSVGLSYSRFMGLCVKGGVDCNRKLLSELAYCGDNSFSLLAASIQNVE